MVLILKNIPCLFFTGRVTLYILWKRYPICQTRCIVSSKLEMLVLKIFVKLLKNQMAFDFKAGRTPLTSL